MAFGLILVVGLSSCNSPVWQAIRKIPDAPMRNFIAENIHILGNVALVAFAFWGRMEMLLVVAVFMYIAGPKIHPLNYFFGAVIWVVIMGQNGSTRRTYIGLAVFALIVLFHLGTTLTALLGLPPWDYPTCNVNTTALG